MPSYIQNGHDACDYDFVDGTRFKSNSMITIQTENMDDHSFDEIRILLYFMNFFCLVGRGRSIVEQI